MPYHIIPYHALFTSPCFQNSGKQRRELSLKSGGEEGGWGVALKTVRNSRELTAGEGGGRLMMRGENLGYW